MKQLSQKLVLLAPIACSARSLLDRFSRHFTGFLSGRQLKDYLRELQGAGVPVEDLNPDACQAEVDLLSLVLSFYGQVLKVVGGAGEVQGNSRYAKPYRDLPLHPL
jgi:hypothetical protein